LIVGYQLRAKRQRREDGVLLQQWEALNSEMTENVSNVLDYLTEGDETKLDAYINTLETSKQQSEKKGLKS
jgi:hypothetical protein